jgi:hypothetical protein
MSINHQKLGEKMALVLPDWFDSPVWNLQQLASCPSSLSL